MPEAKRMPQTPAGRGERLYDERLPPAGPHAEEHLIDREKTPGTGALPEKGEPEADVGPD